MKRFQSLIIWLGIALLIFAWLPLLFFVWLIDRDPGRYRTGRVFRMLGAAISRVNPNWSVTIDGHHAIDDRHPYIIVSNHLSNADIPVISNLPWEMKWIAKKELFDLPLIGWMMRMAGDIPVARGHLRQRAEVFRLSKFYLDKNISVIFFPEGTRSRSGKMNRFNTGAFDLAIREGIPILPLVIDGSRDCLPKKSWVFNTKASVRLEVLKPVPATGYQKGDSAELTEKVRTLMLQKLADMRGESQENVDATFRRPRQDDAGQADWPEVV